MDVLLLRERNGPDTASVAIRLDSDIVAQGKDDAEAIARLVWTIEAQVAFDKLDSSGIGPPPAVYAELYAKSAPWGGSTPEDMHVRLWEGESPCQYVPVDRRQM